MSQVLTNAAEFTVSELAAEVRRTVEDGFGYVRVRGEISGFRGRHSSGHAYFTLKDDAASIDAVVWKGTFPRLAFKPEEGLEVIATGRLTTFPRSSKYQIVIDQIEPAGAGALMALLEERRKKLLAEGLFAPERKRALPYLPRVIGVVTSPTGAVIRDILHRLEDRFPTHVVVWPVRVQGDTCAAEVSAAIRGFNALLPGGRIARPDLLIVARGGGSIEDLWGFNEEAVVRAVAESAIPVISAVGHETDTTLVDYAADRRAPTPTGAAEMAVPVRNELLAYVDDLGTRQRGAARRIAQNRRDRLRAAAAGLPRATDLVATPRQRLDLATQRLESGIRQGHARQMLRLTQVSARMPRPDALLAAARQRLELVGRQSGPRVLRRYLDTERQRLASIAVRLQPETVLRRTTVADTRLTELGHRAARSLTMLAQRANDRAAPAFARLAPAFARGIAQRKVALEQADRLLESVSYERILDRGFALVAKENGTLVRSSAEVRPGEVVTVRVAQGEFDAQIGSAAAIRSRRRRKEAGEGGQQESLF